MNILNNTLNHLFPAGHYMEAALQPSDKEGVVGRLKTPEFAQPEDVQQCASFWYVHNGASTRDKLSVYANVSGEMSKNPLWKERGEREDRNWISFRVIV